MRFDELIGNLTTFEMMFESIESSKRKRVGLQASCEDKEEEDLAETMSLLAKNFNKTLKQFNKKPYSGGNNLGGSDKQIDKGWKNLEFGGSNSGEEGSDNNFVAFTARDTQENAVILIVNDCPTYIMSDKEGDLTEEELMANYHIFSCKGREVETILVLATLAEIGRNREPRQKFDVKSDEGIFLGYSGNNIALRVYKKHTQVIMESINVKVVDKETRTPEEEEEDTTLTVTPTVNTNSDVQTEGAPPVKPTDDDSGIDPAARIHRDHPVDNIIGQIDQGMTTRKKDRVDYRKIVGLLGETCFISTEEPKDVKIALLDEY
ncbi:hypothetical protein LIER_06435 [Lithospermum erythrorhizon]|uniref:Retroviral polymerase SH3-like domain-containing protein n=1 Tax=Lithospermum erythrorhizon TaxID=34254 RepID=A0AAV3P657_LITER